MKVARASIATRAARMAVASLALLLVVACDKGSGAVAPAQTAAAASAASVPTRAAASSGHPAAALAGTWRQLCQPYLPGDGASDITYTITLEGVDALQLAGVAKDYKNTSCAGANARARSAKLAEPSTIKSTSLPGRSLPAATLPKTTLVGVTSRTGPPEVACL